MKAMEVELNNKNSPGVMIYYTKWNLTEPAVDDRETKSMRARRKRIKNWETSFSMTTRATPLTTRDGSSIRRR